jgi:hypothetical protein
MAQHGTPERPGAAVPPITLSAGDLPLSAERLALLEPKVRVLLREFQHLEALEGPAVEPWSVSPLVEEADDAR